MIEKPYKPNEYTSYDNKPYEDQKYVVRESTGKIDFSDPLSFDYRHYRPITRYEPYNPEYRSRHDIMVEREDEIIYMVSELFGVHARDRDCFDKIFRIKKELEKSARRRQQEWKLIKLLEEE